MLFVPLTVMLAVPIVCGLDWERNWVKDSLVKS